MYLITTIECNGLNKIRTVQNVTKPEFRTQPGHFRNAFDATRNMMIDFREKKRAAEFVFVCVRRLLAFSFLKILLE